jgi:hypothetical protein
MKPPLLAIVREVVEQLALNQGGSLAVLRNGGFEQWIRNHILVRSDAYQSWGFTEARDGAVDRTDLLFRCSECLQPTAAVELKTNFIGQSPREITKRISESLSQLDGYIARVPSFLVYCLTHLRGDANTPLVNAQAGAFLPVYKLFDTVRDEWPEDRLNALPIDSFACKRVVQAYNAAAEIRVWIASVTENPASQYSRILSFQRQDLDPISLVWNTAHLA